MKHLQKSKSLAGSNVTLLPPYLGAFKTLASYETSEIVDLICDGPIEGLVNGNGFVLDPSEYFQGVFLNAVPIQETRDVALDLSDAQNPVVADFGSEIAFEYSNLIKFLNNNKNPGNFPVWGGYNLEPYRRYGRESQGKTECTFYNRFYYVINNQYSKITDKPDFFCKVPDYQHSFIRNDDNECFFIRDPPVLRGSIKTTYGPGGYMITSKSTKKAFSSNDGAHRMERDLSDIGFTAEIVKLGQTTPSDYYSILKNYTDYYMKPTAQGWQNGFDINRPTSPSFSYSSWPTAYRDIQEKNKVIGINSDIFWSKDVGNWYLEASLNETFSFNGIFSDVSQQDQPVSRNKIKNALLDVEDKYTTNTNRFLKELIAFRLKFAGLKSEEIDGATGETIKEELIRKLIQKQRIYYKYSDGCDPYVFLKHNENVIDGYDANLHKDIFKNQNTYVENFVENKQYNIGDYFYVGDIYYIVKSDLGFIGTEQDIANDQAIVDGDDRLLLKTESPGNQVNLEAFFYISSSNQINSVQLRNYDSKHLDLLMPVLDDGGNWNGQVFGFTLENINTFPEEDAIPRIAACGYFNEDDGYRLWTRGLGLMVGTPTQSLILNGLAPGHFEFYSNPSNKKLYIANIDLNQSLNAIQTESKYNYNNVLVEFRDGSPKQSPLSYFKDVFIDKPYNEPLLGPYSTYPKTKEASKFFTSQAGPQRLWQANLLDFGKGNQPFMNFSYDSPPKMDENWLLAYTETSQDLRYTEGENVATIRNYSKDLEAYSLEEKASPVTHIINNPNIERCFITLDIQQLFDTVEDVSIPYEGAGDLDDARVGTRFATPLNIRVEVGLVDDKGEEREFYARYFQIIAKIEESTLLDLGNEYAELGYDQRFVKELDENGVSDPSVYADLQKGVSNPFVLPSIKEFNYEKKDETIVTEDTSIKRYIKVTKTSVESFSPLLKKKVYLSKVTGVLPYSFSYPLSAVVGIKTNSKNLPSIPQRTYRCKLKKIKIPSNYNAILKRKDKRYWDKKEDFLNTTKEDLLLYDGDWDGSFKIAWTDNPAWILYDVLTSSRYGLGRELEEEKINKWQLYEIGRFCDSVDNEGYFLGVEDGRGGIEPRFTCNIFFDTETKIFDVINSIASLFRGIIYYNNGAITFRDDRLTEPVAIFNNDNVREGVFSYSNYKKEETYNAVEVTYKDKFDDFKTKVEYVEDQEDIIKRGIFKKTFTAVGVTSKAMAKRAAYHIMIQTTKENESVSFLAGSEALLCNPGDLIIIDDTMKSLDVNYGRVLDVDLEKNAVRVSNNYDTLKQQDILTIYVPTGEQTLTEIEDALITSRNRTRTFKIKETSDQDWNDFFVGEYVFQEYIEGFTDEFNGEDLLQQYGLYVNNSTETIAYYHTGYTGWVFSSGSEPYKEESNAFIISGSLYDLNSITDPSFIENESDSYIHYYDINQPSRRGSFVDFGSGKFTDEFGNERINFFNGVLSQEIQIDSAVQVQNFKISYSQNSSDSSQNLEFGDLIYLDTGDINTSLLPFVPKGTVYRTSRKNSSDLIYKISSIKEEDDNTYAVSASKYYSGKYREIENGFNEKELEETYGHDQDISKVGGRSYEVLQPPNFPLTFQSNGFEVGLNSSYYVSGSIENVDFADNYEVLHLDPDYNYERTLVSGNYVTTNIKNGWNIFYYKSIAKRLDNSNLDKIYLDSDYAVKKIKAFGITENPEDDSEDGESETNSVINVEGGD